MSFRRTDNPTYEQVSAVLSYNPETGIFHWLVSRGTKIKGSVAGGVGKKGYLYIRIFGKKYGNNQLAWLFMTREWQPRGTVVDHKDRDILNNRASNLRLASMGENQYNSDKIAMRGVVPEPSGRWKAQTVFQGKFLYLGSYATKATAKQTRDCVARILYGDFAIPARDGK